MIRVRKMLPQDTDFAARLEKDCFSQPWSKQAFLDALSNRNALYLTAETEEEPVGICGLWQSFEEADITNVAVVKYARRQGVAFSLLNELLRLGRERGITAFTLEVRAGNREALALYNKLGFVEEGVRRNFYENPKEDALIMWKRQETHGTITGTFL